MKRLVALILAVAAGALVGAAHGAAPRQTRLLKGTDMPGFWPDQPHELAPSVKAGMRPGSRASAAPR